MATEEPSYTVSLKEDTFEVRDYPAMVAAEVSVTGDRREASTEGFKLLAGYIFGGNTKKQSIAMTAPVVQAAGESEKIAMTAPVLQTGQSGSWTVRFLMPSSYTMDTLPQPNDARVRLLPVPAARMAVVQFSGLAREDDIVTQTGLLNTLVARHKLQALGAPVLARYNPPWTPWFMRRNEIMVAVQP
ncbi:heme-binding protein [Polaromonas sp.]|uniref:SOUL family heme-binding protein n=1 Tax=Polaromonas sp. TaxID=1869339 RepID=UPI003565B5D6